MGLSEAFLYLEVILPYENFKKKTLPHGLRIDARTLLTRQMLTTGLHTHTP